MSGPIRVSKEDDERFEQELPLSLAAVDAVAAHFRSYGYLTEVICNRDYRDRWTYEDQPGDLMFWERGSEHRKRIEVKGRRLQFTNEETFPFPSIIVDRATKAVPLCEYYVTVNSALTHAAIISIGTRPLWIETRVPDLKRGYDSVVVFMCPKEHAKFVELRKGGEMNEIPKGRSVTVDMAHRFGMEPSNFEKVLRATVVPANCSPEQFAAFLLVAKQYNLNPITKEIYAFPARQGGIQPIVGIDGWIRIINDHEAMNGMEFRDRFGDDPATPDAITCVIYRKDREHPTVVTEYMAECVRDTDAWRKWPARMLRHKAAIQAARYAFGFSGIIDPDEYERGVGAGIKPQGPFEQIPPPPPPRDTLASAVQQFHTPDLTEKLSASLKLTEEESNEIDPKSEDVEAVDPDTYLDDLDAQLSVAKTQEDIEEIRQEHRALEDTLLPPDRDKADFIIERHEAQLRATLAMEAAPKRKK